MKTEATCVLVTEKWQVKPEAKWIPFREQTVKCLVTPKLVWCRGKRFDRATGREITRFHSLFYKFFVREVSPE